MKFFLENIYLIIAAFVSGGLLLWPTIARRSAGPALNTLQATQLMNGKHTTVLDIRTADEFAAGHILNARNIPDAEVQQEGAALPKNKNNPILIVCATGRRAGSTASWLRKQGYSEVFVLEGGINAWTTAGLPTSKPKGSATAAPQTAQASREQA